MKSNNKHKKIGGKNNSDININDVNNSDVNNSSKNFVVKNLFKATLKSWPALLAALPCAVLANLPAIAGPYVIGLGVDSIADAGKVDFSTLGRMLSLLLLIYACGALFSYVLFRLSAFISNRTVTRLRSDAFRRINDMPVSFFDTNKHGDIVSRLTADIDAVHDGLFQAVRELTSGIACVLGALVFMVIMHPSLALIVAGLTPGCFILSFFTNRKARKYFNEQSRLRGNLQSVTEEYISNLKTVQLLRCQGEGAERFAAVNRPLYDAGQRSQFYSSLINPSTRLINYIIYGLLGIFGGLAALRGSIGVGQISGFILYSVSFSQPINNITAVAAQIQTAFASAGRIFKLSQSTPQQPDALDAQILHGTDGSVRFENVDFSYTPGTELIKDFSLDVAPGTRIAIVGPTGSGKTTLVNLLMRFYDIDSGKIYVSEIAADKLTRASLRSAFGMVLQDTWLKRDTVAANIAFGKRGATIEEVHEAARRAGADSFIRRLEKGYDTVIEENAQNISQGQRQLLTIARAMISLPQMLILDEATSNVDTRTEQKISGAFLSMMQGRTSFVIAHRLSTIKNSDLILVLDKGMIAERGTHEQLLQSGGLYYKLYSAQFDDM